MPGLRDRQNRQTPIRDQIRNVFNRSRINSSKKNASTICMFTLGQLSKGGATVAVDLSRVIVWSLFGHQILFLKIALRTGRGGGQSPWLNDLSCSVVYVYMAGTKISDK